MSPARPAPALVRRRGGRVGAGRVRGVSLIELVIVIMLVALTSVLAAGAMGGGFKGMQLRSAAKEIAAQLRHTRMRAIASGETQRFTIDPAGHAWQGADGRRGEIPDALRVSFIGARQVQPSAGEGAILFFSDGASTGGRIRLERDGAAWQADVAWLTGEVRLQRAAATP